MEEKLVRANQAPYVAKTLRKAITGGSKLKTKHFKMKIKDIFKSLYKTEKLLQQTPQEKKNIWRFESAICCWHKKCSKVVKPLFDRNRSGVSNVFVLLQKDSILRDDNEVAKELHSYFNNVVSSLGIAEKYKNWE